MIGKTILQYQILEKLGEGGMGIVYKVKDTKLDRFLALKFLPPHLSVTDTDQARFLQEAMAAAAINHPNVCTIYDIKEHDGHPFIAMEYVDGKTLGEYVKSAEPTPPKLKDLVEYALQIAAGIQAAHEKGVIHRDIKSENIMLSSANQVKVMDFGLAKLKGSLKLTRTSSTIGTLAYMSPEQIEGQATDARSDIFSFGVVLYEMLTGKLPFSGEYESAIMYAILNADPKAVESYRRDLPAELVHVVNRALEKDPEDRYQNMHEVLIDLKRVKRDSAKVSRRSLNEMPVPEVHTEIEASPPGTKTKQKPAYRVPAIVISILILVGISSFMFNPFSGEAMPPMITKSFTSLPGVEEWPTFSPDATQIAYSWQSFEGEDLNDYDIYVQLIGAGSRQLLVGGPGLDVLPSWSSDGRFIAFCRRSPGITGVGNIYIIPARGGTERKLAQVNLGSDWWWTNLSWSPDSKSIAFAAMDSVKDFYRTFLLTVDSRQIQELTHGPDFSLNDKFCAISPNGKNLAFTRGSRRSGGSDIYIVPMTGGKALRLTSDNKSIWGLNWTRDGSEILYCSNRISSGGSIWRISATGGQPRQVPASGTDLAHPVIATQGNLLACQRWEWDENIWRIEVSRSTGKNITPSKLIYSTQLEWQATYSPNGQKIAYTGNRSGSDQVWICDANGEHHRQLTTSGGNVQASGPHWSPDGRMITYVGNVESQTDIFSISAEGGSPLQISRNPAEDHSPSYSRDGKWIYFTSNRTGEWQIWKITPRGGEAVQVTDNGGYNANESWDGHRIYYYKSDTTGIWKKPLPGGEESLVFNCNLTNETQWDLVEGGIYYINNQVINFYDFTTKEIAAIADIGRKFCYDLHVSFDQRWILYTQAEEESDIVLIENFR